MFFRYDEKFNRGSWILLMERDNTHWSRKLFESLLYIRCGNRGGRGGEPFRIINIPYNAIGKIVYFYIHRSNSSNDFLLGKSLSNGKTFIVIYFSLLLPTTINWRQNSPILYKFIATSLLYIGTYGTYQLHNLIYIYATLESYKWIISGIFLA